MVPMRYRDLFSCRESFNRPRLSQRALAAIAMAISLACLSLLGASSPDEQPSTGAEAASTGAEAASTGAVMLGRIDGEINLSVSAYVKRLIEAAETQGAGVVALELNTFGGRVDAAIAIRDALMDCELPTLVFINRRAISAGALISLACTKIAISPGGTIGAATPITTSPGEELPKAVEEKYLSYFRQEMRVTAETNGRNGDIAEAMVDAETEVTGVSEKGKLLTMTTSTALEFGIADVQASTIEEALGKFGFGGQIQTVEPSWSEALVGFLTSTAIASLLSVAMLVLAYLEYQAPGFGVFGFGALTCFLLLYFSHYLVNLAGWEELLLFSIGAILLLVELFVIPGFGVIGLAGLLCLLASAMLMLMAGDWSDITISNPFTMAAFMRVLLSTSGGMLGLALLFRLLPKNERSVLGGRLILAGSLASGTGCAAHVEAGENLAGALGLALTPLRPAGKARIDGQRMNVETEGDFVNPGEEVRVLRCEEGRVVVRLVGERTDEKREG